MTLAVRSIPVVIPIPTQLPLALVWVHPIDRTARVGPDPEPVVRRVVRRKAA